MRKAQEHGTVLMRINIIDTYVQFRMVCINCDESEKVSFVVKL